MMITEAVENKTEIMADQSKELRKLGSTLRYFLIADIVLVLFLTLGFAFPVKSEGVGSINDGITVVSASDYQGKSSPLDIPKEPAAEPRVQVPRYSARTYPLPTPVPINASLTPTEPGSDSISARPPAVSAADAEADLTMRKRTT